MKYIYLIAACLSMSLYSDAQTIKETTVDKFTGVTTISTSKEVLSKYPRLDITGYTFIDKAVKSHVIHFGMFPYGVASVSTENNIIFKLKDNTTISIPWNGARKIYSNGDYLIYTVMVDDKLREAFTNNPVVAIRFETSKTPMDFDISSKYQATILKTITLLTN